MAKLKSINVIIPDGDPLNAIKIGMSSWNGFAFRVKRGHLQSAKNVAELKQCGVYFLYGEEKSESGQIRRKIYVGQGVLRQNGEGVLWRVKEHDIPSESYWTDAIAFVDIKNEWGKTEISYLENRFTNIVVEAKKGAIHFEIVNGNNPNPGNVTEAKRCELDDYIEGAEVILQVLGYDFFTKEEVLHPGELPLGTAPHTQLNDSSETEVSSKVSAKQNHPDEPFPFKIGQVMACGFREALAQGLFNADLLFLESTEACKLFKTRGYKVISKSKTRPEPSHGVRRFAKKPVELNGQNYWITTQVYKEGLPALLSYLEQHGMSRERVIAVCKGEKIETPPASEESSAFSSFREFLQKTMCRASASNYASSFRDLENILLKEKIISSPISESMCQAEVDAIRSFVKSDKAFIQYNKEHHYSRSAAWKKFEEYLASPSKGKK